MRVSPVRRAGERHLDALGRPLGEGVPVRKSHLEHQGGRRRCERCISQVLDRQGPGGQHRALDPSPEARGGDPRRDEWPERAGGGVDRHQPVMVGVGHQQLARPGGEPSRLREESLRGHGAELAGVEGEATHTAVEGVGDEQRASLERETERVLQPGALPPDRPGRRTRTAPRRPACAPGPPRGRPPGWRWPRCRRRRAPSRRWPVPTAGRTARWPGVRRGDPPGRRPRPRQALRSGRRAARAGGSRPLPPTAHPR